MGNFSEPHLCQCLSRISTTRANSPVTITSSRRKTGPQFVECVLELARKLLGLGLSAGDVVAISAYNSDCYLEWLLAVAFVGGIVAPLNYRWSVNEAIVALLAVKPVMLVSDESCISWHSELPSNSIPSLRWHVSLISLPWLSSNKVNAASHVQVLNMDMLGMFAKPSPGSVLSNYLWAPGGAVIICFTSGTTGKPKGVTISHSAFLIQSMAKIAICGYGENEVYLHTAPLCHIGGLSSAMAMLMMGACHVLMPKFEAQSALDAIEEHNVTSLITVPAMVSDLVSSLRGKTSWKGKDFIRKILNGGGSLPIELVKEAVNFFPRAIIYSAYGMTETCSSLTFLTLHDPAQTASNQYLGFHAKMDTSSVQKPQGICVGKPAPHVELRVESNHPSSVGKILTRGPHLMLGYWDQIPAPDLSSCTWFDTGDVGFVDKHGNVWLVGRESGRIKTGGENVYPEEVEAVLSQHPGVTEVVVVGIPETRLSEMVVGCIRVKENWLWSDKACEHGAGREEFLLSDQVLRRYCRERRLTGFKIPKVFLSWKKPFPRTSTGKIRRDAVRAEVISHLPFFHSKI